jgi:hypothetical protein
MFASSLQRVNYFGTSRSIKLGTIKPGQEAVSEGSIVPAELRDITLVSEARRDSATSHWLWTRRCRN